MKVLFSIFFFFFFRTVVSTFYSFAIQLLAMMKSSGKASLRSIAINGNFNITHVLPSFHAQSLLIYISEEFCVSSLLIETNHLILSSLCLIPRDIFFLLKKNFENPKLDVYLKYVKGKEKCCREYVFYILYYHFISNVE